MAFAAVLILALGAGETQSGEPVAAAIEAAEGEAAIPCAVIVATSGKVPSRTIKRLRDSLTPLLTARGLALVSDEKLVAEVQAAGDPDLDRCLADQDCLGELQGRLGAPHLLLVRVRRAGRRYAAAVRYWDAVAASEWHEVAAGAKKTFNTEVATAVAAAIAEWEVRRAEAAAARVPTPDVPLAPIIEAGPAQEEALHQKLIATDAEAVDDTSHFGFELGATVTLFPIAHRSTRLVVNRDVSGYAVGAPAFGLALRLRIPYLPIDDLYVTTSFLYALDDPLLVVGLSAGLEKRWQLDAWAPLAGARYSLAIVGLPVPDAGFAMAISHGVELYAGAAVGFGQVPISIALTAGYRVHFNRLNQFGAGGQVYFARDATAEVWIVDLSGPVATLSFSYAY